MFVMSETSLTPNEKQETSSTSRKLKLAGAAATVLLAVGGVVAYNQLNQSDGSARLDQVGVTATPSASPDVTPTPDTFPTGPAPVGGSIDNFNGGSGQPTPAATVILPK